MAEGSPKADMAVPLFGTVVLAVSGWAAYHQMRTWPSGDRGGGTDDGAAVEEHAGGCGS